VAELAKKFSTVFLPKRRLEPSGHQAALLGQANVAQSFLDPTRRASGKGGIWETITNNDTLRRGLL